jgi:hypothetical protein
MKLVSLITMCLNEMYGRVWVGKHLSGIFVFENDLKQGYALSPFLFSFPTICHYASSGKPEVL